MGQRRGLRIDDAWKIDQENDLGDYEDGLMVGLLTIKQSNCDVFQMDLRNVRILHRNERRKKKLRLSTEFNALILFSAASTRMSRWIGIYATARIHRSFP